MKSLLISGLSFLISTTAWAQMNTAEFLNIGVGGRAVAMGEAYAAVADDDSAIYWNTAALTRIDSKSVTFMHSSYIDSSSFDFLAYGQNMGRYGAFAVGMQRFSAGAITETNTAGVEIGTFNPSDLAVSLGYGYRFNGVSMGLGLKYVRSEIIESASAVAMDLGVLSPAYLDNKLTLAFTATNLGSKMKFESASESLPTAIRFGSVYRLNDRWLTAFDLAIPESNDPYAALGTEYIHALKKSLSLACRLGLNTRSMGDINGITGINFGMGFQMKRMSFDYALVPFGSLSTTHRISVTTKF